jgi:putative Holliday junction resolvase
METDRRPEESMRALGIDVGSVRLGLALSDPLGMAAQPLEVIRRTSPQRDLEAIRAIALQHEVEVLVIGLPYNMNGSEGPAAQAARDFARLLEPLGLPVEFIDERASTMIAEAVLLEGDVRRDKRKHLRDKLAASIILQTWLDQRARGARA